MAVSLQKQFTFILLCCSVSLLFFFSSRGEQFALNPIWALPRVGWGGVDEQEEEEEEEGEGGERGGEVEWVARGERWRAAERGERVRVFIEIWNSFAILGPSHTSRGLGETRRRERWGLWCGMTCLMIEGGRKRERLLWITAIEERRERHFAGGKARERWERKMNGFGLLSYGSMPQSRPQQCCLMDLSPRGTLPCFPSLQSPIPHPNDSSIQPPPPHPPIPPHTHTHTHTPRLHPYPSTFTMIHTHSPS